MWNPKYLDELDQNLSLLDVSTKCGPSISTFSSPFSWPSRTHNFYATLYLKLLGKKSGQLILKQLFTKTLSLFVLNNTGTILLLKIFSLRYLHVCDNSKCLSNCQKLGVPSWFWFLYIYQLHHLFYFKLYYQKQNIVIVLKTGSIFIIHYTNLMNFKLVNICTVTSYTLSRSYYLSITELILHFHFQSQTQFYFSIPFSLSFPRSFLHLLAFSGSFALSYWLLLSHSTCL